MCDQPSDDESTHEQPEAAVTETMKQVRQKLGAPTLVSHNGGSTDWFYNRRKLLLEFRGKSQRLHLLYSQNRAERTAGGIGVGSSRRDVIRTYPGVLCQKTPGQSLEDCGVFSPDGTRLTDFQIGTNGRVHDVGILAAPF